MTGIVCSCSNPDCMVNGCRRMRELRKEHPNVLQPDLVQQVPKDKSYNDLEEPMRKQQEFEALKAKFPPIVPARYENLGMRRTGRTTRMLALAAEKAQQGYAIYVLCLNKSKKFLETQFATQYPNVTGVKFDTRKSLVYAFDDQRLCLRTSMPKSQLLIDHAYIESRYSVVLDHLHAFDEVKEEKEEKEGEKKNE